MNFNGIDIEKTRDKCRKRGGQALRSPAMRIKWLIILVCVYFMGYTNIKHVLYYTGLNVVYVCVNLPKCRTKSMAHFFLSQLYMQLLYIICLMFASHLKMEFNVSFLNLSANETLYVLDFFVKIFALRTNVINVNVSIATFNSKCVNKW